MEKINRDLKKANNALMFQIAMLGGCVVGSTSLVLLSKDSAAIALLLITSGLSSAPKSVLAGISKLREILGSGKDE